MNFFILLDIQISLFLNGLQNRFLDFLTLGISWLTEGGFLWLLFCLLILIFDKKERKRKIILILIALLLSDWLVNIPFKMVLFCRKRPYQVLEGVRVIGKIWGNCSFPSGHLAVSVAAILIISYLYNLKKGWFIFSSSLFILFLAFARIYVGMHYLSDVLGGIILGFISSLIIIYLERQIKWQ